MITLYGISNCDTMRKARRWLDEQGLEYHFHDYRKAGVPEAGLRQWVERLGWEALLNRRGMTWRKLPEERRRQMDETGALKLMAEQPAIIKRPVLERENTLLVGFEPQHWLEVLL